MRSLHTISTLYTREDTPSVSFNREKRVHLSSNDAKTEKNSQKRRLPFAIIHYATDFREILYEPSWDTYTSPDAGDF